MRYFTIVVTVLFLGSCNGKKNSNHDRFANENEQDTVSFNVFIEPSFSEVSEIDLLSTGSSDQIKILIKNNVRVDEKQDTFYYRVVALGKKDFKRLDSALLQKAKQNIPLKQHISFDGMSISFILKSIGEIYHFGYFSPNRKSDEGGYLFTKSVFDNLKSVFKDSIVNDYLDEVETYIDESKLKRLTKETQKSIYKLRRQKYSR